VLSRPLVTRHASLEEIGVLMGGLHGMAPELSEAQSNAAYVA